MRTDIEQLWADDKRIVSYEFEGDRDLQKWLKVVDYSLELAYDGMVPALQSFDTYALPYINES
jgi:hypothetical protein